MKIKPNELDALIKGKKFAKGSIPIIDYSGKSVLVFPIDVNANATGLLNTRNNSEDNPNQKCLILDTIMDPTKGIMSRAFIGYMYFTNKDSIKYSYSENVMFYTEVESDFYKGLAEYDAYIVPIERIVSENILLTGDHNEKN